MMNFTRAFMATVLLLACTSYLKAQSAFLDSITHDGITRTFIVHLPTGYDGTENVPLVMVLHGGGSGDGTSARDALLFEEIGDTANYITVFPNGVFNDWADSRGVTDADLAGIDDVSFLTTLKNTLIKQYAIDRRRTYLAGVSNGGMMALRIAWERPRSFAAYAPIIANLPDSVGSFVRPGVPLSVLLMSGTADNLVPYEGGLQPPSIGGRVVGVDSTIALLLGNNGCPGRIPNSQELPDLDQTDGSTVTRFDYGPCNNNAEIVLYRVNGGGHTVPGNPTRRNPRPVVGFTNFDIDAATEIWAFFEQHAQGRRTSASANQFKLNSANLSVYPNPITDRLFIQADADTQHIEVKIYDQYGAEVYATGRTKEIALGFLPEGIYYVKATFDGKVHVQRVVKSK